MSIAVRIGLIGDYDHAVPAHQAIPRALALVADETGIEVAHEWVPTDEITSDARVEEYDALWCVPASPYLSTEGALRAIRFAREQERPFLGTSAAFSTRCWSTPAPCSAGPTRSTPRRIPAPSAWW